jgi:dihydrofolate synthase / folylpolyglutamate synthase
VNSTPPSSQPVLERISRLHPRLIDLSLDRVHRLLARLGDPHARLPPVVHVAGTNGKGSVIAFLAAVLTAAGYRVHTYVSPHLVRFHERIRLAGTEIDDRLLATTLEDVEAVNAGDPITFFEITTAAAFVVFARVPGDVLLLETGLGGRLDATNVVARPVLTVLTPISLDHQHFLGNTVARIAAEKAGILKPGVPCVVAAQTAAAERVIARRAAELGVPLSRQGKEWRVRRQEGGFVFSGRLGSRRFPAPNLAGGHQVANAGTALASLERMPAFAVKPGDIGRGLGSADWPGRLHRLAAGLPDAFLPPGWELWLDGGHNPAAARVLARHLDADWRGRPVDLVFGMMRNRDAHRFLAILAPRVRRSIGVAIPGTDAGLDANEAAAAARDCGIAAEAAPSVPAAVAALCRMGNEPARILVCGSLYLVGTVLAAARPERREAG